MWLIDHVEMALVDRHVDRLADRAAGMVQPGRGLRELHEVAEILDRAVAAALVEIHDEGRAVGRREDDALAADLHRLGRVARMLGELRRRGLQDLAQHARLEPHQHAVDLRAGPLPMLERCRIVAELDADLGQDAVGGLFDPDEVLLGQDVVGRDVADDVGPAEALGAMRALLAPRRAPAAFAPACRFDAWSRPAAASMAVSPRFARMLVTSPDCLVTLENP